MPSMQLPSTTPAVTIDHYDGSYVENHCPECNEFESECLCESLDAEARAIPADYPHYCWLIEQRQHAQAAGESDVLALIDDGLADAERCQSAWRRVVSAADGQLEGLELATRDGSRFAAILRDPSDPGRWRAQFYDAHGFSGHQVEAGPVEVLESLIRDGFHVQAAGAMQRLSQTATWAAGTRWVARLATIS